MSLLALAETSTWSDPIALLIAAVGGETAAIVFLVVWVRGLYEQRRLDAAEEMKYRDDMIERVLNACAKLAEAVAVVTARRG